MTAPAGVVTVKVGCQSFVIAGNKGIWVPEGEPHEVVASTEVQLRNLQISRTLAPDLPQSVCPLTVSPLFNELLRSAVEGKQWFVSGSRESKVLDLLVLEFHPADDLVFSVPEPKDARLRKICAAIQKDPSDNKSLAEWADTAGGCTRTLERSIPQRDRFNFRTVETSGQNPGRHRSASSWAIRDVGRLRCGL